MAPTFDLRISATLNPSGLTVSSEAWSWFWRRNIVIKGIEAFYFQELMAVNHNIRLVAQPLTMRSGAINHGSIRAFPSLIGKLNILILEGSPKVNELAEIIPYMTHLTSIVDKRAHLSEDELLQLVRPLLSLEELKLEESKEIGIKLLEAILPFGPTLRSLGFDTENLKEEHYQLIAQHCPHLTVFHLEGTNRSSAGVAAIAMGCSKLQDVDLSMYDSHRTATPSSCPCSSPRTVWS